MNRIENTTKKLSGNNEKSLVGYFMAGEFSNEQTLKIMHEGVASGLDIIELGFPFSDPTADGGTIQVSAQKSLKNGTKLEDVFTLVAEFRTNDSQTPIILMGYFNIIFQYGEAEFLKKCSEIGVDGIICVDLPIEESSEFEAIANKLNICVIQIVSFLTNKERFAQIQARARGFIYLVSTLGTTGQSLPMVERIASYIQENKPTLPIFVGFGVSSPEIAASVSKHANGVIIGSYFIESARKDTTLHALKNEISQIKNSIIL
jgi:tryptophan synthase alpha chain